jgi:hypothetical protein
MRRCYKYNTICYKKQIKSIQIDKFVAKIINLTFKFELSIVNYELIGVVSSRSRNSRRSRRSARDERRIVFVSQIEQIFLGLLRVSSRAERRDLRELRLYVGCCSRAERENYEAGYFNGGKANYALCINLVFLSLTSVDRPRGAYQ